MVLKRTIVSSIYQRHHRLYNSLAPSQWFSTVGLEIHAQIDAKTKLFSSSESIFAARANANVNLLDAAIPGTLPVLNKKCVELAVGSGLALGCTINPVSHFDRKHYFYADLPSGYQITQQRSPIAREGTLSFHVYTAGVHKKPYRKTCRLKQIQLEQDSGKSLHDPNNSRTLIDLNRAGIGLMEFVFEPDLKDGEEAAALVKELMLILGRTGSCSCKMEEGALRVDANVSVSNDPDRLGVRTEVKNIGSVRGVAHAVQYEIERQIEILSRRGSIINETRNWDPQSKRTISMRDKEEKQDYRFMPEPNLPPLRIAVDGSNESPGVLNLSHLAAAIPELPEDSRTRLIEKYDFSDIYAIVLVNQPKLYQYFTDIMKENAARDAKIVWNVLLVQLLNVLYKEDLEADRCTLPSGSIGETVDLLQEGSIDYETCRTILSLLISGSSLRPTDLVKSNNWYLVSDPIKIEAVCQEVISRNPKTVKKYKKGKEKVLQFMVKDVANVTKEKIKLSLVSKRLKEILKQSDIE